MRILRALLPIIVLLGVANAKRNAVPFLQPALAPMTAKPGSGKFTLTINGAGFSPRAIVMWNGSPRATSILTNGRLQAQISADDVAKAGTIPVTVVNPAPGGGTSNTLYFSVQLAAPSAAWAKSSGYTPNPLNVTGDFNNDGNLDIAAAAPDFFISSYLGNGDGTFGAPFANHSVSEVASMVTGDFNQDGLLDMAVGDGVGNVTVFLNHGNGVFIQKQVFSVIARGGAGLAVGDFNGDGALDIVSGGYHPTILLGNGDGTFRAPKVISSETFLGAPAAGDLNGDGILDLVFVNGDEQLCELMGYGDGTFSSGGCGGLQYPGPTVTLADVNGDGNLDIITDGVEVLLGDGHGGLGGSFGLNIDNYYADTATPVVGDFNGDGKLDIAVVGGQALYFLQGNGDGTFQPFTIFPGGGSSLSVGDFNNDGKLDLLSYYLFLQDPVSLSPTNLNFGNQNVGTKSQPQNVTTINVGGSTLPLTGIVLGNPRDFSEKNNCGSSLLVGQGCQISVTFHPQSGGQKSGSVIFSYNGIGSPQTVSLSGFGVVSTVSLTPAKLTYSALLVGTSSPPQTATLTNTGTVPVNISSIATTAEFTQYNNCPSSLPANGSCQIQVVFAPTKGGHANGTLTVADDAEGSPQLVALSGVGIAVKFEPIGINCGDQQVGTQSSPVQIQLTNVGPTALTINGISLAGKDPGDFSQTNNCGTSVPAGGSCQINVTFSPQAKGKRSAYVEVQDNGGASPQKVPLTGTGT